MSKVFPIIVIAVAIIAFSASSYLFSETDISIDAPISIEIQSKNSVKEEIKSCIEQNLAGDSSVVLNSFNTNMLLTMKEHADNAKNEKELEEIRKKLYTLINCKP